MENKLLRLLDFCEIYEIDYQTVSSNISSHKSKFKKYPNYVTKIGTGVFITPRKYFLKTNLQRKIFSQMTDSENGLFWIITEFLGVSERQFAMFCATQSDKYKSIGSWYGFINSEMFNVSDVINNRPKKTQIVELLPIAIDFIGRIIKDYKKQPDNKKGEYTMTVILPNEENNLKINYKINPF